MEDGQMIEILENKGRGFSSLYERAGIRIAYVTKSDSYGELSVLKRHTESDEVFILLSGEAALYSSENLKTIEKIKLERGKLYNITKNTWHHLEISDDAELIAVENSSTSKENTDSFKIDISEAFK